MMQFNTLAIRSVFIGLALIEAATAYGQAPDNRIGMDVTPKAQVEINRENAKREAEAIQSAEARAEQDRQRAAQMERARLQEQARLEAARVQAQGEVEAAKNRIPDVCVKCYFRR